MLLMFVLLSSCHPCSCDLRRRPTEGLRRAQRQMTTVPLFVTCLSFCFNCMSKSLWIESSLGRSPHGQSGPDDSLSWRLDRGGGQHTRVILIPSLTHCRPLLTRLSASSSALFRPCFDFFAVFCSFWLREIFKHSAAWLSDFQKSPCWTR